MENIKQKIVEIITRTHRTPFEQADEILLLFGDVKRNERLISSSIDFNLPICYDENQDGILTITV